MSQNLVTDLEILIDRDVDGHTDAEDIGRLNELLRNNPGASRTFAQHLNLDSVLTKKVR